MSKKIRDGLLIVFTILFVILTIITSLYASGYKFNLSWPLKFNRLLQKTGMLAVATKPARALIYLNGDIQYNLSISPWKREHLSTPTKVKNILPGRYELDLKLDGYWPYRQTIDIKSGETTFVENVLLFKKNSPILVVESPKTNLLISPDFRYLYAETIEKIINLKNESARTLLAPEDAAKNDILKNVVNTDIFPIGQWLKNGKFFQQGKIFDPLKESNDADYKNIIGSDAYDWHYDETTESIYYRYNQDIAQFNLSNQSSRLLTSDGAIMSYRPKNGRVFIILKSSSLKLTEFLPEQQLIGKDWSLPNSGDYIFIDNIPNYLSIYDNRNKALYLFNELDVSAGPLTINNINYWKAWGGDSMLYANDYEIQIFNFQTGRSDLITRRSEKINDLLWNSIENYLIFATSKYLNIFDFKNGYTTNLVKAENISSPVLDEKNNNLYFWAKINDQEGIYKINLR